MNEGDGNRNPAWEGREPLLHPPLTKTAEAALFAAYERTTGRTVWPSMTNLLFVSARKHGPDTIPLLEALHAEYGVEDLLLRLKAHPVRGPSEQATSSATEARLTSESPIDPPQPKPPTQTPGREPIASEWTEEDMAELDGAILDQVRLDRRPEPKPRTVSAESRPTVRQPFPGDLDSEVAWRVDVMRPQCPEHGAIPVLVARPGESFDHDRCVSCGVPLSDVRTRCKPCVEAANIVLEGRG